MASTQSVKVAIITSSTRTPRIGPSVTDYIKDVITSRNVKVPIEADYSIVDVADFNLPVFDETVLPAMVPTKGSYSKPHTIKWSETISQYAAYIFVTGEYNYGVPSSTKNAVDFLYNEWADKPAVVVSYGIMGGNRANEQLSGTLEGMKMRVAKTRPALPFHGGSFSPDMFAAIGGNLGDDTKADWDKEKKADILEAVKELEEELVRKILPRREDDLKE